VPGQRLPFWRRLPIGVAKAARKIIVDGDEGPKHGPADVEGKCNHSDGDAGRVTDHSDYGPHDRKQYEISASR